jgi:hypothetical protein
MINLRRRRASGIGGEGVDASSLPEPFGAQPHSLLSRNADVLQQVVVELGQSAEGPPLSTTHQPAPKRGNYACKRPWVHAVAMGSGFSAAVIGDCRRFANGQARHVDAPAFIGAAAARRPIRQIATERQALPARHPFSILPQLFS